MFVLTFVDNVNCSEGPTSVSNGIEIIGVSDNLDLLKKKVEEDVLWETNDMKQEIGYVSFDGEVDNDMFYVIVNVD